MKWIIVEYKKVNLEEATLLGGYTFGNGSGDFNYIDEKIYETKNGNFVFIVEGGANTKYGENVSSNTRSEGRTARFIDKDTAIHFLSKWGEHQTLLDRFGDTLEEA